MRVHIDTLLNKMSGPHLEELIRVHDISSLEDWLQHEGIFDEFSVRAIEELKRWEDGQLLKLSSDKTKGVNQLPIDDELITHLLIVGETGSGKSTMARKILAYRETKGRMVILDPHAIQPNPHHAGDWGRSVVGAGRDYISINDSMVELSATLDKRYQQRGAGKEVFEDISIFIDEWPSIKSNCEIAAKFLKDIAREGRKVGMRLVILTQSALVESLGLKGEGDTRENFSFIVLGNKARRMFRFKASDNYPALLDYQNNIYCLNHYKTLEDEISEYDRNFAFSRFKESVTSFTLNGLGEFCENVELEKLVQSLQYYKRMCDIAHPDSESIYITHNFLTQRIDSYYPDLESYLEGNITQGTLLLSIRVKGVWLDSPYLVLKASFQKNRSVLRDLSPREILKLRKEDNDYFERARYGIKQPDIAS